MYILFCQRSIELLLQNIFNAVDDKVYTLYWRINNTQFFCLTFY